MKKIQQHATVTIVFALATLGSETEIEMFCLFQLPVFFEVSKIGWLLT
jgi:hypothetical protein